MKIQLPCRLGQLADCEGKQLILKGVSWFRWSRGLEYTYYFGQDDYWHDTSFCICMEKKQPYQFDIPDSLIVDKSIKEHGYPLKGSGYAYGVHFYDGITYIDFIMTSNYLTHIKVQCDGNGEYMPNGKILFPPSWDTDEKRENAILKAYKFIEAKPLEIKEQIEFKQLTIFDFAM